MVSPRKFNSAAGKLPEGKNRDMPTSSKSCESLYSNASSSKGSARVLYSRKAINGGISAARLNVHDSCGRQSSLIPATQEVRQRVLSARRLRMKTFQNQLTEAQQTISELLHENRFLRTLHKRQDSALAKYEKNNAELPKLLHSHDEELRVWQAKHRNTQATIKEYEQKLKQKELIILTLSDQNKYFSQLNRDKNLDERQKLTEKLHALETLLEEKDNEMKLLARKMQLEKKNFKQQLHLEQKKSRDLMLKLEQTRMELSGYRKITDVKIVDKLPGISFRRKPEKTTESKYDKQEEKSDYENTTDTENQASHRSIYNPFSTRTVRKVNITTTKHMEAQSKNNTEREENLQKFNELVKLSNNAQNQKKYDLNKKNQQQLNIDKAQNEQKQKTIEDRHNISKDQYDDPEIETCEEDELDGLNIDSDIDENSDAKTDDDIGKDEESDYMTTDLATDNQDEPDSTEVDEAVITNTSSRIKKEMSSIRKQITNDYEKREAFLDTFCRQATNSILSQEADKTDPKQRMQKTVGNRKSDLLATLK